MYEYISPSIIEIYDVPYNATCGIIKNEPCDVGDENVPVFAWHNKRLWGIIPLPHGDYKLLPKTRYRPHSRLIKCFTQYKTNSNG